MKCWPQRQMTNDQFPNDQLMSKTQILKIVEKKIVAFRNAQLAVFGSSGHWSLRGH
jgi:hypothetical protein